MMEIRNLYVIRSKTNYNSFLNTRNGGHITYELLNRLRRIKTYDGVIYLSEQHAAMGLDAHFRYAYTLYKINLYEVINISKAREDYLVLSVIGSWSNLHTSGLLGPVPHGYRQILGPWCGHSIFEVPHPVEQSCKLYLKFSFEMDRSISTFTSLREIFHGWNTLCRCNWDLALRNNHVIEFYKCFLIFALLLLLLFFVDI